MCSLALATLNREHCLARLARSYGVWSQRLGGLLGHPEPFSRGWVVAAGSFGFSFSDLVLRAKAWLYWRRGCGCTPSWCQSVSERSMS